MRVARERAGLSQEDLGLELDPICSQPVVSEWERRLAPIPLARVAELARILGVPGDALLDDWDDYLLGEHTWLGG
jgi:transcriptional regulator with XRE-family HTH domain